MLINNTIHTFTLSNYQYRHSEIKKAGAINNAPLKMKQNTHNNILKMSKFESNRRIFVCMQQHINNKMYFHCRFYHFSFQK